MARASNSKNQRTRHDPLYKDIDAQGGNLRVQRARVENESDSEEEAFVDAAASRRILQLAKEQQEEIEQEENMYKPRDDAFTRFSKREADSESESEEISDYGSEFEEEIEIDEEDAKMFEQYFQKSEAGGSFNLADKIMASIREKEMSTQPVEKKVQEGVALPPKVIKAYTAVGQILTTWTHGKLPKLFKVLPSLKNWQDVLYVTNPEAWTPHVVYEATKLFVSNLGANEAQKFISLVLLDRFRVSIEDSEDHTLNYHIYRSLKKSLYKPSAFFKGFLFPLVESGCNVREATIAGSVLSKVSVPALHSAAALSYLLRLDFSPATTVFIRILLEKKYALPYQTIDDCVFYFMNFRMLNQGENSMDVDLKKKETFPVLPVVWHKAFLAFAQRYKNDITDDQRDFLMETVRQRGHKDIGPEIRRELMAGVARIPEGYVQVKDDLMVDVE